MSKGFPRPTTTIGGPADAKMAEIWRYSAWVGLKGAERMRKSSLRQVWGSTRKYSAAARQAEAAAAKQAVVVMGEGLSCHHHDHTA